MFFLVQPVEITLAEALPGRHFKVGGMEHGDFPSRNNESAQVVLRPSSSNPGNVVNYQMFLDPVGVIWPGILGSLHLSQDRDSHLSRTRLRRPAWVNVQL